MLIGARGPAHLIAVGVDDLKSKRPAGATLDRAEAKSIRPWNVLADEVIDVMCQFLDRPPERVYESPGRWRLATPPASIGFAECPRQESNLCTRFRKPAELLDLGVPELAPYRDSAALLRRPSKEKLRYAGLLYEPSNGLEPLTPPLPSRRGRLLPVAAGCQSLRLRGLRSPRICFPLPPFATALLHNRSMFVVVTDNVSLPPDRRAGVPGLLESEGHVGQSTR